MRILLNFSILHSGGSIQVAHSVLEEWKNITQHQYCVIFSNKNKQYFNVDHYPNHFEFHELVNSPSHPIYRFKSLRVLKAIETNFNPDVVFTLFGPSYWHPRSPHLCGYALPHHIYPDSPYFNNISLKQKVRLKIMRYLQLAAFRRDCDYYVVETHDAASRLARRLNIDPEVVFIVNNAYNGVFDDPGKWTNKNVGKFSSDNFKMITISSFYPHKNLGIIPKVIDYLVSQYPDFNFSFILTIDFDKLGVLTDSQNEHIEFIGKVDIEQCPSLYQQSDALFMPTLLECFTVSYLEAMKMERPILTSDLPFARDICGVAATYFDPLDPISIGESIYELAHNKLLQKRLKIMGSEQLKKFGSAQDRAIAYLDILEQIHGNNTSKN